MDSGTAGDEHARLLRDNATDVLESVSQVSLELSLSHVVSDD